MNFTIKEVSEILSVSEEQVRRWCRNKKLKVNEFSSRKEGYIIDGFDFIDFLDKHPKYKKIFDSSARYTIEKFSKIYSLEEQIESKKLEIAELEKQLSELKNSE